MAHIFIMQNFVLENKIMQSYLQTRPLLLYSDHWQHLSGVMAAINKAISNDCHKAVSISAVTIQKQTHVARKSIHYSLLRTCKFIHHWYGRTPHYHPHQRSNVVMVSFQFLLNELILNNMTTSIVSLQWVCYITCVVPLVFISHLCHWGHTIGWVTWWQCFRWKDLLLDSLNPLQ